MSRRTDRVNSLLREELSLLIQREMNDPRVGTLVSITAVETSADLQTARVFVSVFGGKEDRDPVMKALTAASGFLRKKLRDRLEMRQVPELHFTVDTSIEEGQRLLTLIDQVTATDEKTRARRPDQQ
ncbi:MAG: 30S ribosome-binding factor RbfA [Dehalococcoidia bacterium]|nr:30S ribosome-binding factor RbfA [Dehalococcoidia bacterium]